MAPKRKYKYKISDILSAIAKDGKASGKQKAAAEFLVNCLKTSVATESAETLIQRVPYTLCQALNLQFDAHKVSVDLIASRLVAEATNRKVRARAPY